MKKENIKAIIVTILFILALLFASYIESHYERTGKVTAIEGEEVFVTDAGGNEWSFYGTGYTEGDNVKMFMFTNHTTSNIFDDEIIKVKLQK